jgi:hypothetical protein
LEPAITINPAEDMAAEHNPRADNLHGLLAADPRRRPTDLRTAPLPAHNYAGEYQGLAALPDRGFAAIFTLASPQARNEPTDIFFARIGPG